MKSNSSSKSSQKQGHSVSRSYAWHYASHLSSESLADMKERALKHSRSSSGQVVQDARDAFGIVSPSAEVKVLAWPKL